MTEDGPRPQLLDTLALNDWIKLMAASVEDPLDGLVKLRKVHSLLANYIVENGAAAEKAEKVVTPNTPATCFNEDGSFDHPPQLNLGT